MSSPRVIRSARGGHRGKAESQSTGKKKWVVLAALFLLISSLGAWAMLPRTDPQLQKVQELRAQLETAPQEQRRELWDLAEEMEKLPEETREQLFAERRQEWEARENKMLDDFFSKSKAEQIAQIDKDINESEQRRAERDRRRAQGGAQANRDGGGRGGNGERRAGGRDGDGGGGRGRDSAARLARSKRMLDQTTPERRAQRAEYRRMRDERREKRGLPT